MHIRKHLWINNVLNTIKSKFTQIKDEVKDPSYSLSDCLMSCVAMFGMKYSSLLKFDKDRTSEVIQENIKNLYKVNNVPCDTTLRERLDLLEVADLQPAFDKLISELQRGKVLDNYRYIDEHYLIPIDGTGFFSSNKVHCKNCCEKHLKNGTITYHHDLLSAVIVSPQYKEVFPIGMEFIVKQDGNSKNDCELNAAKRLLKSMHNSHPHLKKRIVGDALYANGNFIKSLKQYDMSYILTIKDKHHKYLISEFQHSKIETYDQTTNGITFIYKYSNNVQLNDTHHDLLVNVVDYTEFNAKNEIIFHSIWITDVVLTNDNIINIVKGARSRWKIENETFNTLKNQGYNFEHNFGHGNHNLSNVMACLMMLAFLIDQIQQHTSNYFAEALKKQERKKYLYEKMFALFTTIIILDWEKFYRLLIEPLNTVTCDALLKNSS